MPCSLQAQPVPDDMVKKTLGNRATFSPIVTVEPRRRKFHKPITMTIPVPPLSGEGVTNGYKGDSTPCLRLLCSITGKWFSVEGNVKGEMGRSLNYSVVSSHDGL